VSEIPDDIMETARATLDKLLCHCSESCGGYDGMREAAAADIGMAILEERHSRNAEFKKWLNLVLHYAARPPLSIPTQEAE
jgi:hypothetical protein